jgi:hypothetical protein
MDARRDDVATGKLSFPSPRLAERKMPHLMRIKLASWLLPPKRGDRHAHLRQRAALEPAVFCRS